MNDPGVQAFLNQLDTLWIALQRPVVQRQLAAFLAIILAAWLLPMPLGQAISRLYKAQPEGSWRSRVLRWAHAAEYLLFPLLGLLGCAVAIRLFDSEGLRSGLIDQLALLFWLILVYRLIGSFMFAALAPERATNLQRRYVVPIFFILAAFSISTIFARALPIGQIVLIRFGESQITFRSIFLALFVVYVFLALSWLVRALLDRFLVPRVQNNRGLSNTVQTTTRYAIIGLGGLLALSTLGFDLSALAIIGGGLSVGIGFGLQELVANFISGILLMFEQSLRVGDVVEVGGQRGVVNDLRMRATVLRTIDNSEVFVPNKTLLTSTVTILTLTDHTVRRVIPVGVSYDCQPTQVRDVLLKVAESHGVVLKDPAPAVFFTGFGESSLDFELAVWLGDPSRGLSVVSDLRYMIFSEFAKNGIEIPFPQRDLHVRSADAILAALPAANRQSADASSEHAAESNGSEPKADFESKADAKEKGKEEAEEETSPQRTSKLPLP